MAVVLYQGGDTNKKTNPTSGGGSKSGDQSELERIQKRIESLSANVRPTPYIGLQNQGATCYMNSLIQTLFMTPQVRQHIYSYRYDPSLHGNKDYCIPYQLQRLFANLQLSRDTYASTKALTKSFHWTSSESFQQQDVQEFCRVLFDAIDQSFNLRLPAAAASQATEDQHMGDVSMTELYEGASQGFVKCLVCGHESIREDRFQDLSLPIRNEFGTGVQNSSVEMALENYIKPEVLDGDNQYNCEQCSTKVDAEKGIKLVAGPPVLTIALNRFTLDYNTFQRVKIMDRVSFGQVINFNDYLHGYENIKNKKYEAEVERMNKYQADKVEKNRAAETTKQEKLAERERKRQQQQAAAEDTPMSAEGNSQSKGNYKEVINGEEVTTVVQDSKPESVSSYQPKREAQVKITVGTEAAEESVEQASKEVPRSYDEETYNRYMLDASGPRKVIDYSKPAGYEDDYADVTGIADEAAVSGQYRMKHQNEKFSIGRGAIASSSQAEEAKQQEDPLVAAARAEEEELKRALEQIRELENRELIAKEASQVNSRVDEYLEQGEFVYELYSIMVHSGGAYGGHYYAYIKSFEDGKWYNFNDSQVTEIENEEELFKTFGDSSGHGGTAYLLMYRKISSSEQQWIRFSDDLVPRYLQEQIEAETAKLVKEQKAAEEKLLNLNLKVYHQDQVQEISLRKTQTLIELIGLVLEKFGITEKEARDCRLRAYDALMKVRLGVFDSYDSTLLEIKNLYGRSTLALEMNDSEGNFEEYNPNWVHLRAIKWREGETYDYSRPDSFPSQMIVVDPKTETVQQLEEKLAAALNIPVDNLIVLLRHEHGYNGTASTEYFNMAWRKPKMIGQCSKLDHGKVLFCEEGVHGAPFDTYYWHQEFAQEAERITISINDVANDLEGILYNIKISLKKSDPVRKLKEEVAKRFNLELNEFYLVRHSNEKEIKDLSSTLVAAGLTSHSQIKVVLGTPSMEGAYQVKLSVVQLTDDCTDRGNQLFTASELGSLVLNPEESGLQFKEKALALYNAMQDDVSKQIEIDGFRIRAPQHDFGELVHDDAFMSSLRLFDDKEFYLHLNQPEKLSLYEPATAVASQGFLVLLTREWDPVTWQFGDLHEFQVPKNMRAKDFGNYVREKFYPHIAAEHFFGTKVTFLKSFTRSDLATRSWSTMIPSQNPKISESKLDLVRDSALIVVRDWSKQLREELDDEELKKYASQAFKDHLKLKSSNAARADAAAKSSKYDGLLEATQNRVPDYSKARARPEVGVSIQVGITHEDSPIQEEAPMPDNVEGGIYIEDPFGDEPY